MDRRVKPGDDDYGDGEARQMNRTAMGRCGFRQSWMPERRRF